jgi:hypothetical protein
MDDIERQAREHLRQIRKDHPKLFSKAGNREFYRAHMAVADIETLVDLARDGDKEALDFVSKHVRQWHQEALRTGAESMNLPASVSELALEILAYGPPKNKTRVKDHGLRDQTIALLVRIVSDHFRFPVSRNPEYRGENEGPMTACRLVAEEFGLAERTVENIWRDRKAGIEAAPPTTH